jgi:hypothetical protein
MASSLARLPQHSRKKRNERPDRSLPHSPLLPILRECTAATLPLHYPFALLRPTSHPRPTPLDLLVPRRQTPWILCLESAVPVPLRSSRTVTTQEIRILKAPAIPAPLHSCPCRHGPSLLVPALPPSHRSLSHAASLCPPKLVSFVELFVVDLCIIICSSVA